MVPNKLRDLVKQKGRLQSRAASQIFHAQAFPSTLFMLKKGYVKRYQITKEDNHVIELIYGPGHIFPLSQLYKRLFGIEQNQAELIYVYEAMTDIDIWGVSDDEIIEELQKDTELYIDLFYEGGLRLKSNIERLASNALKDDYKKVAHQLMCLGNEFGEKVEYEGKTMTKIKVPLQPVDMAEQLNISVGVADAVMNSLNKNKIIHIKGSTIYIPDEALLKDEYL